MSTITITRASVAQVPTEDFVALYRAALSDGSATVLVADRKASRTQADVRVRADKAITVRRAANSLAHRWGWTREQVLAHYGTEDSRAIVQGSLRDAYLHEQGTVRING